MSSSSNNFPVPVVIQALKSVSGKDTASLMTILKGTVISERRHDEEYTLTEEEIRKLIEKYYNELSGGKIEDDRVVRAAKRIMASRALQEARKLQHKADERNRLLEMKEMQYRKNKAEEKQKKKKEDEKDKLKSMKSEKDDLHKEEDQD